MHSQKKSHKRHHQATSTPFKIIYYIIVLGLTVYGLWSFYSQGIMKWLPIVYGVAMVLVYGLYAKDKHAAKNGLWRTPESTLHLLELLGGWISAFWAQERFRHKTKKLGYQLTFWVIVTLHGAFWTDVVFLDMYGVDSLWRMVSDSPLLEQMGFTDKASTEESVGEIFWSDGGNHSPELPAENSISWGKKSQ